MSIITSIIQSILQAICWIFPISESAHSSIYHDFSYNFLGAYSNLTGAVHIGIAIGILVAMYKLFFKLSFEFFGTGVDIFKKQLKTKDTTQSRKLMYMTLLSFAPMILWLIPVGKGRVLYSLLKSTQYNKTLLDDGLLLAFLGMLLFLTSIALNNRTDNKNISVLPAVIVGFTSVLAVPVAGLSLVGCAFAILTLFGVSRKISFRYGFILSVPVLLVMGIAEMCTCFVKFQVLPVIIAIILSAVVSFIAVRVLKQLVLKGYTKYIAIYDLTLGGIVAVVGVFELIFR